VKPYRVTKNPAIFAGFLFDLNMGAIVTDPFLKIDVTDDIT
jgi:hypothetical protein